jgi:hypothetical protein
VDPQLLPLELPQSLETSASAAGQDSRVGPITRRKRERSHTQRNHRKPQSPIVQDAQCGLSRSPRLNMISGEQGLSAKFELQFGLSSRLPRKNQIFLNLRNGQLGHLFVNRCQRSLHGLRIRRKTIS